MLALPAVSKDKEQSLQAALSQMLAEFERSQHVASPPDGDADPHITTVRRLAPAPAEYAPFPEEVDGRLVEVLRARGIEQLYTHQAEAIRHALAGRNVVTVTPTASGKTLCYNAPVLDAILKDSSTRALYLFPTKALAQDQLAELQALTDLLSENQNPGTPEPRPSASSGRPEPVDGSTPLTVDPESAERVEGRNSGTSIGVFTYDGDTPNDARRAIRGRAHIVLSNPDMVHSGILPHHPRWAKLFENLTFVVIDELHTYRGVFGSHLANIIRRLLRICAHYGSNPTFICSSATIANPSELAERLVGAPFELVEKSGAPRGEKYFLFVNPPVVSPQLGIRRSYLAETRRVAIEFLKRGLQSIVFAQSRLATEILTTYLKDAFAGLPGSREAGGFAPFGKNSGRPEQRRGAGAKPPEPTKDVIRGYRGGYLPGRRREIERGLRSGEVRCVVSTNALELGMDIGALDVAVMAGYPGTIAATWQRAGRAGRRTGRSAAVLVASSAPIDQFVVRNPEYFFGSSPEHALVNPDNLHILLDHVKCAAFELPFRPDETFGSGNERARASESRERSGDHGAPASERVGGPGGGAPGSINVQEVLAVLSEEGFVQFADGQWQWTQDSYPADAVSLRSVTSDNFVVVDVTGDERVIGETDFTAGPATLHEKAIYLLEGELFQVERLDFEGRKAFVRKVECDYYTDAITYTKVTILETFAGPQASGLRLQEGLESDLPEARGLTPEACSHGEVHVVSRVVGFKKIKFYTNENVGSGELNLPEQEMHTTSYWMTIPAEVMAGLAYGAADRRDGVVGLAFAMRNVAPLLLMCDSHDLGLSIDGIALDGASRVGGSSKGAQPEPSAEPTIFIYDNYPGGIGFSEPLFSMHDTLLARTRELIDGCPCQSGCPSCVGPEGATGPLAKAVASRLLASLARVVPSDDRRPELTTVVPSDDRRPAVGAAGLEAGGVTDA